MCEKGSQGAMPEMSTRVVLRSRVPEGGEKVGNLRVRLKMERAGATNSIDAAERGHDARVLSNDYSNPRNAPLGAITMSALYTPIAKNEPANAAIVYR